MRPARWRKTTCLTGRVVEGRDGQKRQRGAPGLLPCMRSSPRTSTKAQSAECSPVAATSNSVSPSSPTGAGALLRRKCQRNEKRHRRLEAHRKIVQPHPWPAQPPASQKPRNGMLGLLNSVQLDPQPFPLGCRALRQQCRRILQCRHLPNLLLICGILSIQTRCGGRLRSAKPSR